MRDTIGSFLWRSTYWGICEMLWNIVHLKLIDLLRCYQWLNTWTNLCTLNNDRTTLLNLNIIDLSLWLTSLNHTFGLKLISLLSILACKLFYLLIALVYHLGSINIWRRLNIVQCFSHMYCRLYAISSVLCILFNQNICS